MTLHHIGSFMGGRTVLGLTSAGAVAASALAQVPKDLAPQATTIQVLSAAPIEWDPQQPEERPGPGFAILKNGQLLEASIDLPPKPSNQRDARRITATLIVEPSLLRAEGNDRVMPGDPWTRLGSASIVTQPLADGHDKRAQDRRAGEAPTVHEMEFMRFITGFGGAATYTQDVTALAPVLAGKTTFRVFISTYRAPAWKVSLSLTYTAEGAGYRRPAWASSVFNVQEVTAQNNRLRATVQVPAGLAQPRVHVISTGHASDGADGDEFVSRSHILRIDGREVARWRPWADDGGAVRDRNPMSGRRSVNGRELWSSDWDRSGWHPGAVVQPLRVPTPELLPGAHTIELEIVGIRPRDARGNYGYWRVSAIALADEPWPQDALPRE